MLGFMKKYVTALVLFTILLISGCTREETKVIDYQVETTMNGGNPLYSYENLPNVKYAWWFKRNDTHSQPEAQTEVDISQYDAWYVAPDSTIKVVY